ncbi:MAG: acyl-CoA transferase [Geminicoccaceae bacterium]
MAASLSATIRRNEALPERVPAEGLMVLRDGDPGEPDITLNPRTEFYSHRVELEVLVTRAADGSGEAILDALIEDVAAALAPDASLGGLAENLRLGPPETGTLAIDGAAPILTARLTLTVEYLASDPLAA